MAGKVCAFWHPNHIKRHHERAADAQIASLKQQAAAQKQETAQLKATLLEQINATHSLHQQEIHDGYQTAHNAALDERAIAKQVNDELLASLSFFWIYGKALIKVEYEAKGEAIQKAKEIELLSVPKDGFFTRLFGASSRFEQDLQQVDAKFKQSFDNLEIEKAELLAAFEGNYRGAVREQNLKFAAFIDRHEAMLQALEIDKALKLDELNVFFDSQKQLLEEQYVADLGAIDAAAQKVIGDVNSSLAQHFKELDSNRRSFAINGLLIIGSSLVAFAAPQFLVATIGKAAMITLQVSAGTTAVGAANNLFNDTGTYAINANFGLDQYNHKPYSPPIYQSTPNWHDEVYFPDSGQRIELNPFNNNRISNYPNVLKPQIYSSGPSNYSSENTNNASQHNRSYAPIENRISNVSAQATMPKQVAQQPLTPPKSGMLNWSRMAWRSLTNDKSPEVLNWQKNNRNSFPTAAVFFDSINNSKSQKAVNAFSDALVNRAAMPIMFAAEEVSRMQQQQQTKTKKFIHKTANVIQGCKDFVGNDTERFLAQETTQTQIFFESVGNFIAADYQRLREGQTTITGTAITQIGTAVTEDFKALANMSSTEIAAQLGHEAGDTLLFFMAGGALHKGHRAIMNVVDTAMVVGSEFIAANKSPLIFRMQHEAMSGASPFNVNRLHAPIAKRASTVSTTPLSTTGTNELGVLHRGMTPDAIAERGVSKAIPESIPVELKQAVGGGVQEGGFAFDAIAENKAGSNRLASTSNVVEPVTKSSSQKLTKAQIVEFLQNVDKIPLKQLINNLEELGFELLKVIPEQNIYKFSHVKNTIRGTGKAKANLESSKYMIEIHCDAISGPHMHIIDTHGNVYDKNLNNLNAKYRKDNPGLTQKQIEKRVERLPEAHIEISEFVELNLRPRNE